MPRKYSNDDDMPRPRRRAKTVAIDAGDERGLLMRIFLYSPKDMVAGAIAFAAVVAIVANALFLQPGRHPAPMFGSVTVMPAVASVHVSPVPRPRPVEANISQPDLKTTDPRAADPLASLVRITSALPASPADVPRPPLTVPASSHSDSVLLSGGSRRVAAVQRALTEYGYGQLKPTGITGPDTQAAIQKFERTRRLPVTGQVSDRLVRELAAMIGHPIN